MYFNVVIKDNSDISYDGNQLVFHFDDNLDEVMRFVEYILTHSEYHVEILQFFNKNEKEK